MGIKERQDRERHAVRESILDAARELFTTEGYRNVSIRKIADRIEYSPAAIYSYFSGKDDIYFALAEEGFRLLSERVAQVPASEDAMVVVRAEWRAFYEFSKEHAAFFELMFVDRSVPRITEQWEAFDAVAQLLERAIGSLRRAIESGALPSTLDPMVTMHVLWGALTGPALLGLTGRLAPGEDPDCLADDVFNTMMAGFRAGPHLTFSPCEFQKDQQGQLAPSGDRSHES